MVSHNYIKTSIVFLACLMNMSCQERDEVFLRNDSTEHIIVASLETNKSKASFYPDDSLNLLCRWDGTERLNVYYRQVSGEYSSYVADALISDVGEDRMTAQFTYTPDKKWNVNDSDSYETAVFTLNCFPTLDPATGSIHLDARLLRQSLKNFGLPVYYVGESSGGKTTANFVHYYTYELLHIRNSSGKKIDFSLNGFEATPIWFKTTASYCIDSGDSDNKSWTGIKPVDMSAPVSIEPQCTEIIVSAYIPTGYNIKDATMVATIDGEPKHSINKITSNANLRQGHAYHMYADWDGTELKFVDSTPEEDTNEPVDLGLSVKWASCNLGASKPEEYGDYYAWGATEPWYENGYAQEDPQNHWKSGKSGGYYWENTPFNGGSSSYDGSYWNAHKSECVDGNGVLLPENDAAHVQWGGKWRMPTEAEFQELIDNCTSEWTTLNGVKGRKFTSKKNGSSIFLPAAGYRESDRLYNVGSFGNYGSSSLSTGSPCGAYYLGFGSGELGTSYYDRFAGHSVRPVYDEGQSGQAVISVSPEEVEFEKVYLGESATATFTITNSGTASASVSITNPSDVVTSDVSGDITINAGASKTVTLTFTPKEKGSYGGRILVSCGGTNINVLYEGTCIEKNNDGPEAVDLGLSVKWASCNLGASKPEGYGGYYQWGGLEDVTDTSIYLDWPYCPYHTGSSFSTGWTKYIPSYYTWYWSGFGSPDDKTVLDPEDDVAHVTLGGKWRMPTEEEFNELRGNCTSEWTTLNGVKGRKFTSKKNGNSIFLPAAGYRYSGRLGDVASYGYYWSSSLNTDSPRCAYRMLFYFGDVNTYHYDSRYYGHSVRPVYDEGQSGQAVISVSPEEVEFEKVYLGESATATFTITNSGTAPASVSITNPSDVVTSDVSGNITIGAGASKTVTLTFTPKEKGSYGGRILVSCGGTDINVLYEGTCIEKNNSAPEAVDLGLSVKWASCNLGASKPEDFGGHYQWAGIQDVTDTITYLDFSNCPYHTGFNYHICWTKYIPSSKSSYWSASGSPDNKTVLDPEDDVAHVKLGGTWRMPTDDEWWELQFPNNCSWTWTTINGINGYKVQSKKPGYTDKWIFLPAAGYVIDGLFYDTRPYGDYWYSSLDTHDPEDAFYLYFDKGDVDTISGSRYCGRSVRPVSE